MTKNRISYLTIAALTVAALAAVLAGTSQLCFAAPRAAVAAVSDDDLLHDWMLQDHGANTKACFASKANAAIETKMLTRVLDELAPAEKALRAEMARLIARKAPGADAGWRNLYTRACLARRARRLRPMLAKHPKIIFAKHYDLGGSHYAYTEGQSDAQAERHFRPGAALCLLSANEGAGTVRTLVDAPKGVIRDPDVSADGKRILFSWKKSDRQDDYHLYEMNATTEKIRQLTFGLGFADYEGAYLPNGDIVFNSSRCVQIVDCWWTEVSNLYVCDKDGKYLRRLTFDQVHTNYPTVTDDGRVIYTRWDYNDRGQLYPQPLFQMNPDGTAQTELYGNNSWFPTTVMHARGIPGTQKIISVLSGHHSRQRGKLAVIDPTVGNQEAAGVQLIAPVRETKAVRVDAYGQGGEQWQYPYPMSETEFVVTYRPGEKGGHGARFGIYFMDIDGRRELLVRDGRNSCNQPVPLAPRKRPHNRPSAVDYRKKTGTYFVKDVYFGPGLKGISRGTVKRLRVVALEFRAAGVGSNGNRGPAGGALVSTPVAIGNGTWDVKTVLGSTPVHEDGSAMFIVPARTPVYFQLLDEKNYVVQSMRSWSTLQPGETFACAGCHEDKNQAAPPSTGDTTTLAQRKGPQPLEPFYGPARGFSFPKEIQPILDKKCISCHDDRSAQLAKAKGKRPGAVLKNATPILPINSRWRYTTIKPAADWNKPIFDSSKWQAGQAGFGKKGTPGGRVYTTWARPEIWIRTDITLPPNWTAKGKRAAITICHDEDAEVYVNGRLAGKVKGHIPTYKNLLMDAALLRPGTNVVAVHCRQTTGGQFIDVGLLTAPAPKAAPPPPKNLVASKDPSVKKAFSLLGETTVDARAKRRWSDSYLALTQRGKPNAIVQWLNVQSIPPMLPPYFAGAAKSGLMSMLEKGHYKVKLSREEMDKLACWIDLLVPYCGDYTEANAWNDGEKAKYARFQTKRDKMAELEQKNIEAMLRR